MWRSLFERPVHVHGAGTHLLQKFFQLTAIHVPVP